MKKLSALILFCCTVTGLSAQYATVVFDFEKSTFNENQPLPAESYMMFTGAAGPEIEMIEVNFYRSAGSGDKKPLYMSSWKRSYSNISETFNLPMNYKLKGGQKYDVEIKYYRDVSQAEKATLRADLFAVLDNYVDMTYSTDAKKIALLKQYSGILSDLNGIVISAMQLYRSRNDFYFESFSDVVKLKLKQIEDVNLKKEARLAAEDSTYLPQSREKLIQELKEVLQGELKQYLRNEMLVLSEAKKLNDYATEKTRNELALNAGYAATFFDTNFKDLDYGSSPYLGISVPLANRELKSAVLSNTSISAGVFLLNMEDNDGNTVTGPFIKRPLYLGLGYKVFKFIRLNAGAVLLEKELPSSDKVIVRGFVGASIDVNFWMGIDTK